MMIKTQNNRTVESGQIDSELLTLKVFSVVKD